MQSLHIYKQTHNLTLSNILFQSSKSLPFPWWILYHMSPWLQILLVVNISEFEKIPCWKKYELYALNLAFPSKHMHLGKTSKSCFFHLSSRFELLLKFTTHTYTGEEEIKKEIVHYTPSSTCSTVNSQWTEIT